MVKSKDRICDRCGNRIKVTQDSKYGLEKSISLTGSIEGGVCLTQLHGVERGSNRLCTFELCSDCCEKMEEWFNSVDDDSNDGEPD